MTEYVSLEESLKLAFTSMEFADMTIECSDGVVFIHRSVLAAASPLLRPLLKEYNAVESNCIFMPDVTMDVMKQVISLIYTGTAFSTSVSSLQEILIAAKLLGIQLEKSCEIVNVVVLNEVKVEDDSGSEDDTSDGLEIIKEITRKRKRKRVKSSVKSETAANVIREMFKSGELQLTAGPGYRGPAHHHPLQLPEPFSHSNFPNIPYSMSEYDGENEFAMSQEEILESFKVSSQKDHAYGHFKRKGGGRGGRGRELRGGSGGEHSYTH